MKLTTVFAIAAASALVAAGPAAAQSQDKAPVPRNRQAAANRRATSST